MRGVLDTHRRYFPPDLVVTTTAVASDAARALTTLANFKAAANITASTAEDSLIGQLIARTSDLLARECGLVETAGGERPTFGNEKLTATWLDGFSYRGHTLVLPWRVPATEITSVVEDGVTLVAGTDYVLVDSRPGRLLRLEDSRRSFWSAATIVVVFKAGWTLPASVPPEVEAAAIEQMRAAWFARARDPNVLSEQVPDVYSATYSVGGGETMGDDVVLPQVLTALTPYWNPAR
jgi:hypothetical protein